MNTRALHTHKPGRAPRSAPAASRKMAAHVLLLAVLLLAGAATAAGQAATPVDPAQVTIAGERGQVQQRTLLLHLPPDVVDVRFVAQDLPTAAGDSVLPAAAIHATLPATATLPSGVVTGTVSLPLSMTVAVDLAGVSSGGYSGEGLVYYALPAAGDAAQVQWQQATVTMTVNVKSQPFWPLVVLAFGLILGIGLTLYRERMRPIDRILARLAAVENRLEGDTALAEKGEAQAFRTLTRRAVADALTMLRAGDIDNAGKLTQRAEQIVDLWQRERAAWLAALQMQNDLIERIDRTALADTDAHLASLRAAAEGAPEKVLNDALETTAPKENTPSNAKKLVEQLEVVRQHLQVYMPLAVSLADAEAKLASFSGNDKAALGADLKAARGAIEALSPTGDLTPYSAEVDRQMTAIKAILEKVGEPPVVREPGPKAAAASTASTGGIVDDLFNALFNGGRLPTPDTVKDDRAARLRLTIFAWTSWAVALILLGGTGFNELYVKNVTFGAAMWTDYLGLLAWGFGAEASRNAIVKMVQGWGVPGGVTSGATGEASQGNGT